MAGEKRRDGAKLSGTAIRGEGVLEKGRRAVRERWGKWKRRKDEEM